jgi:hypothetical protein
MSVNEDYRESGVVPAWLRGTNAPASVQKMIYVQHVKELQRYVIPTRKGPLPL